MNTVTAATVNRHYVGVLLLVVAIGIGFYSRYTSGVLFWCIITLSVLSLAFFLRYVITQWLPEHSTVWANTTLFAISSLVTLILCELAVVVYEHAAVSGESRSKMSGPLLVEGSLTEAALRQMQSRQGVVKMPDHWTRRALAEQPGNFLWHGVLHRHDQNRFRRNTPLPAKDPARFRIVVVGDSLTYGYGVAEEFTYPAIIERLLAQDYKVEVLNLGVSGNQSTDILGVLRDIVTGLAPDLVIYGVCLNDFLPSDVRQYQFDTYAFPLPEVVKTYFIERTRLGSLVSDLYGRLLLKLGVRQSFMDDILTDFDGYQARFARDVEQMSRTIDPAVPFISMVLHQYPELDSQAHIVTGLAEQHLLAAGIQVIASRPYFDAYHGRRMAVSPWEGHPNELAHALYASLLVEQVQLPARFRLQ